MSTISSHRIPSYPGFARRAPTFSGQGLRTLTLILTTAALLTTALAVGGEEIPIDEAIDLPVEIGLAAFETEGAHHWKRMGSGIIRGGDAELARRAELERAARKAAFELIDDAGITPEVLDWSSYFKTVKFP